MQERSSLPLTPHSRIASPHLLPPIVPWRLALRQHLLTRGCRTHRMMSDRIIRPPFHLQAPFRGDPGFPAKSASFSSQLPPSHAPPPNMVHEVGTAWRKNETKRLVTPSRLPFPPISGLGRVVTRRMIVSVSEPPPYAHLTLEARKWSLG